MSNKLVVIKTGGKQYKVSEGDKIKIEKLPQKDGSAVSFSEVLLYSDEKGVTIGAPVIKDVKVAGKILEQGKADKVIIYKHKKRKRYTKKKGHRQQYTQVEITSINKKKELSVAPKVSSEISIQK